MTNSADNKHTKSLNGFQKPLIVLPRYNTPNIELDNVKTTINNIKEYNEYVLQYPNAVEIIETINTPIKYFLDIENYVNEEDIQKETDIIEKKIIPTFTRALRKDFENPINSVITKKNPRKTTHENKECYKLSYRVVYYNVITTADICKIHIRDIFIDKPELKKYIDINPYSNNRKIILPLCYKNGDETKTKLLPITHKKVNENYFITNVDKDAEIFKPFVVNIYYDTFTRKNCFFTNSSNEISKEDVKIFLDHIDSNIEYKEWLRVLNAVHNILDNDIDKLTLLIEWSKKGSKYYDKKSDANIEYIIYKSEQHKDKLGIQYLYNKLTKPNKKLVENKISPKIKEMLKLDENPNYEFLKDEVEETNVVNEDVVNEDEDGYTTSSVEDEKVTEKYIVTDDDKEACQVLLKRFGDIIKYSCKDYWIKNNGIWHQGKENVKHVLLSMVSKSNLVKQNENGKLVNYTSKYNNANNIVKLMMAEIAFNADDEFYNTFKTSTKGKILFNNGYYDFTKKQFIDNFDGVNSVIKINRNYNPVRNETLIKEVYERVIYSIFGGNETDGIDDNGRVFLQFLARAIAGHTEDKKYCVGLGERNSGKGMLGILLETAFTSYIITINSESFLKTSMKDNTDMAKKLSWMMSLEHKRICKTNEFVTDKKNKLQLNANLIKKITGNDRLQARTNNKDEREFNIQASLMMFCNDLPPYDAKDGYETMVPYTFAYKFINELTDEMKKLPLYKQADSKFEDYVKRIDVADAFIHILQDFYEDKPVELTSDMINIRDSFTNYDIDDDNMELESLIEPTGNENDLVKIRDLNDLVKQKCCNISKQKVSLWLKNRGIVEYRSNKSRYYRGCKLVELDEDSDEE